MNKEVGGPWWDCPGSPRGNGVPPAPSCAEAFSLWKAGPGARRLHPGVVMFVSSQKIGYILSREGEQEMTLILCIILWFCFFKKNVGFALTELDKGKKKERNGTFQL